MIELNNLTKRFGDFTAVDHLNLTIGTGEFFGLLGPNGAGKTTTISMMSTVLLPTEGSILIDGQPLTRAASSIKRQISIVTQEYSMRPDMTPMEVMEYQGRLYRMRRSEIKQKTEDLFEFAGLTEHRYKTVRHLSGGMKRKLMICRALMTDPSILLLDEPTAGMDALARRQMWNLLRSINSRKMTIILTTHYMEEAETLCDRIALVNDGKLDLVQTPEAMIEDLGKYAVDTIIDAVPVSRFFTDRADAIAFLETQDEKSILRRSTLEDVFVERVGSRLDAGAKRRRKK